MKTKQITIIGLDRLGCSIGLALLASGLEVQIIGHDSNRENVKAARQMGAVHKEEWNLLKAVTPGDIVILSLPQKELALTLEAIGQDLQPHTVLIDLSGMKAAGLRWASQYVQQGHYIGARAVLAAELMADGRSGPEAARADLLRNSIFCLMPDADVSPQAVETAVQIGALLGAKPFFLDAAEYDNLVQGIELLPGLMSAALFSAVTQSKGWRDMLRFADTPFALATAALQSGTEAAVLIQENETAVTHWLDLLIGELKEMRKRINAGEPELMAAILGELNEEREKWLRQRSKNEWEELIGEQPDALSIGAQLFGKRWDDSRKDKKE